ncbi:hypothetical protein [Flavobacterium gyeonganense]|uniref:Lipoprotein n=1 Tax=Flavobacterium gyeonganense TaxID=1310418 RepID=A0ABV5H8Z5_9FLAO|nr:hypothetical protein [Flavobacterium gyeonganense]
MKTIILTSFLFLLLHSCASKKEMSRDIEFIITDKSIVDNSFINLKISNKTTLNYYLPIINSPESEKWKYELSSDQNRFFFIYKVGYNFNNEKRHWISENCIAERDVELEESYELWNKKKESIGVKDLILLKSGESIKIKLPMNLHIEISKYCNWELKSYKTEKLSIGINYPNKEKESAVKFLNSKTLDSLKQMGYKLYDKEINSNKVPLVLEN